MRRVIITVFVFFLFSCQIPRLVRSQLENLSFLRILSGANKFRLGGTVSGLLSGGSVSIINGTQTVTVTQDGVFFFPERFDTGVSYDLSISTSGNAFMNCTITNGKGIVQTVDIQDVVINCGLGSGYYEIGVNVSGITAPITVQNNATESLTISAAGLFKFPTPLLTGQNFAVTITAQTTGSVCSFVNPTASVGIVATLNVTVAIRCIPGFLNSGGIHNVAAADLFPNLSLPLSYLRTMVGSYPTNAGGTGAQSGNVDNTNAPLARFNNPKGMVSDGTYFYIADYDNDLIRRVNKSNGEVTTFAGGAAGGGITCPGAVTTNCLDGIGTAAQFYRPFQLTTDGVSLYVLEFLGNRIRRINLANAEVTTLAGSGNAAFADNTNGILASFTNPHGIILHQGTLYVADRNNNRIRAVNPVTGSVTTFVGSGAPGFLDANGTSAQFFGPIGIAAVGGFLYVADHGNNRIRKIDLTSPYAVTTIAGQPLAASVDGYGLNAQFDGPFAMTSDGTNLIVSDYYSYKIRHIRLSDNKVTTLVGGVIGYRDSAGMNAGMQRPAYPASDGIHVYFAEEANHAIRRIETAALLRYSFDGDMNDSIGTNHGTPTGSPIAVTDEKGTSGGAYEFDGSSQFISSTSNVNFLGNPITDDLTVSLWIFPRGKLGTQFLFYNGQGGVNGYGLAFDGSSRRIQVAVGGTFSPLSTEALPLNQWTHVTVTRNNGAWQMYINGINQAIAFNNNPTAPTMSLKIADNGTGFYFQGKISEFRFFKGALDQITIQKLAAQVPNGLVAYYPMNGNANDFSGNDNHATVLAAFLGSDRTGYGNSAYYFDGTAYLERFVPVGLPTGNSRRTLCAWVNTFSNSLQTILGYGTTAPSSGSGLALDSTIGIFGVSNDVTITHEGMISEWVHVCGAYDGINGLVYLNGVLRKSEAKTWTTTPGSALQIGRLMNGTALFYGAIDDVRIYNRVLSQAEIRALSGVHPTQVSTWNPTVTSSSLKLFLKPESTGYANSLCPGGINCVYDWYDRSGNNFHLNQILGASQPAYESNVMRGKPGIRFFGATVTPSFLTRTCQPELNGSSNTIFTTYREISFGGNNGIFQNGSPTSGKLLYFVRASGNNPILFNLFSNTQSVQTNTDFHAANETVILTIDYNGSSGTMRKNGAIHPSTSNASPTFTCGGGTLDIGRYYFGSLPYPTDGGYFDGHIGDFIYFDGVLSTADRELVECYLSNRYNLPISHSCP